MKRTRRSYGNYKGRATLTDKLRVIALILLGLVVLSALGLYWGQRYLVQTEQGLRLELPFLQREEEPDVSQPDAQNSGEEGRLQSSVPLLEDEKEAPEPELWLRAAVVSLEAAEQGTALEQLESVGANAAVLDMKTDQGELGFSSQQPLAPAAENDLDSQQLNERLKELSQENIYLIARISCFRDHALGENQVYAIETNPGRRWYDEEQVRWSSPASQAVRDYLTGVMEELAQLGFNEILLDNWGYPTKDQGNLEYIKKGDAYDPETLDQTISVFLQQAETALKEYDVRLSVRVSPAMLAGEREESGQTLAQLTALPGRIWLEGYGDAGQAVQKLEQAGIEDAPMRIVSAVSALDPDKKEHQILDGGSSA